MANDYYDTSCKFVQFIFKNLMLRMNCVCECRRCLVHAEYCLISFFFVHFSDFTHDQLISNTD